MLLTGVDQLAPALMRERLPVFLGVELGAIVVVLLAARNRPLDEAMLLAFPLASCCCTPVTTTTTSSSCRAAGRRGGGC